jgi:hypothetical protein
MSHADSAVNRCHLAAAKEYAMGQTPFTKHIWFHYPYVMPADVLSDEPTHEDDRSSLREEASCDGLCYLKLTQSLHDGTHLARVAASPDALRTGGYTIVVNDTQLAKACPWHALLARSA